VHFHFLIGDVRLFLDVGVCGWSFNLVLREVLTPPTTKSRRHEETLQGFYYDSYRSATNNKKKARLCQQSEKRDQTATGRKLVTPGESDRLREYLSLKSFSINFAVPWNFN
jgi:hypothetical protein